MQTQIKISVPPSLRDQLAAKARSAGLSLSSYCAQLIERSSRVDLEDSILEQSVYARVQTGYSLALLASVAGQDINSIAERARKDAEDKLEKIRSGVR